MARSRRHRGREGGNCWPSERGELLLDAALLEPRRAGSAWQLWRDRVDLRHIDPGAARLLPTVYRNLLAGGEDFADRALLKQLYLRSWSKNQVCFRAAGELLRRLDNAAVPTLLLKGTPLALLHYRDAGARPMADVDILVPPGRAYEALAVTTEAGFAPVGEIPDLVQVLEHGWPFRGTGDTEVDLQWRVFLRSTADEQHLWARAVPFELDGASSRAPSAADQLLHTLGHGLEWSPTQPLRWIVDAIAVLKSSPDLDWSSFEANARRHRLLYAARELLPYLRDRFEAPIPASVIASLRASPTTKAERRLYRALLKPPPSIRRSLRTHRDRYVALAAAAPGDRRVSFPTFLLHRWELAGIREIPAYAFGKYSRRRGVEG